MLYLNNTNGGSNKASLINFRVGTGDGLLGFVSGSTNECDFVVATDGGSNGVERLRVTNDGRGLSQFTAKAWVNFNGEGTLAVRDSHNVSSVTDNASGDYTVNFSNNLANANYAFSGGAGSANSGMRVVVQPFENYPPAVGSCRFNTTYVHGSVSDSRIACVTIFGD